MTIQNNNIKIAALISFVLCFANYYAAIGQSKDYIIFEKKAVIEPDNIEQYYNELSSFYSDNYCYDFVHLRSVGGKPHKRFTRRLFCVDEDSTWTYIKEVDGVISKKRIAGNNELANMFDRISPESYMVLCDYSNVYDLYMVKREGKVVLTIVSEISIFNIEPDPRLDNFIDLVGIVGRISSNAPD